MIGADLLVSFSKTFFINIQLVFIVFFWAAKATPVECLNVCFDPWFPQSGFWGGPQSRACSNHEPISPQ